ncbi:MAG: TIGR03546 family protein [Planctomycetaceae bacterium]
MFFVLRPVRVLLKALLTQSTPAQMSWGFALGVLVGLVPKGNLLAIALGMVVAMLRVNLGVATATAIAVTFAASWFDPVSDAIGRFVLSLPSLQQFWIQLYNTPVMPWTDFNNSIVMGSFLLGLGLLWPLSRSSRPVFEHYADLLSEHARHWRLAKVLLGAEWADRLGSVE